MKCDYCNCDCDCDIDEDGKNCLTYLIIELKIREDGRKEEKEKIIHVEHQ